MSASRPTALPPRFELVVVLASLGGLPALSTLVAGLPVTFPVPVLILQHRLRCRGQDPLVWLLTQRSTLPVRTAYDGMPLRSPGMSVIPAGATATAGQGRRLRIRAARPAAECTDGDILLASAATAVSPGAVIAVVLSGRMRDGATGVQAVKRRGGRVLAQDPATATAPGMPASAMATGCVDFVLPPQRIPAALIALAMAPGGAQLLTVPTPHWVRTGT